MTSVINTILIIQDPTTISFEKFLKVETSDRFFYGTAKHHCMAVLNEALKTVLEYFTDDLPEVGEVDSTDPFCVSVGQQ